MIGLAVCVLIAAGCISKAPDWIDDNPLSVSLGITYIQQGDFPRARMVLNQASASQPRAPSVWSALAYLEESTGNLTAAALDYRHAIQLSPNRGDAHNNYGVFLCRHGDPRAGLQELLKAVQFPSYIYRADAYENAGRCALMLGDPAAARTYFEAALRNDPRLSH